MLGTRKPNAPELTASGRGHWLNPGARDRARTGDPHVGKEMLALISLRFFAQSGHIDAFRSIVGEGWAGREVFFRPPPARREFL